MTVKNLKECFSEFNIKTKIMIPDNREITNHDIEEGKIFQKFVLNENIQRIVSGLEIHDNKICYFYVAFDSIEIETDEQFPPCGGEQEIAVYAYYSIRMRDTDGNDSEFTVGRSKINAIIKIDNSLFSYEKPNLINKQANNTDVNNYVKVYALYYYKGKKYEDTKQIEQGLNKESSWLVEEEPTQFISMTLSENEVSNKGGIVIAKVERHFTRISYKKDTCGNKIKHKSENDLIEDITRKSLITISNKKNFSISKNIITVNKQSAGAAKRECTITARYMDKTSSVLLVQKEGGKITYSHELEFADGSKMSFIDLETSLPTERKISIISKKNKYIDGEFDSIINTNEFKIESDSEWVYGEQKEGDDGINIFLKVIGTNEDKNNDREATLTITSTIDTKTFIKLIVYQQSLEIKKEQYCCSFVSDGEYTPEEIDNSDLYFSPYKLLIYEDDSIERVNIEDYMTVKYVETSSDSSIFSINKLIKKGENYHVKFNNFVSYSIKDITFAAKLIFYDVNNEKIFESNKANIIVKSGQIIDYNYELCFNNHNKYEEVFWVNSTEPKIIKVNSLKHKMINGKYSDTENIPFKVGIYDENGNEFFDDNFSIKISGDEILVFPIKTNKNLNNIYTITQKETGEKMSFKLSYEIIETSFEIPLKVIVYSNKIGKDVWTGENGYLLIDGNEQIKLNPCWLSPNMKDNVDTAYNGIIELKEGTHIFETFNVLCIEYGNKTYKDCNIYNEITVNESTKNIILKIKV